MSAPAEPWTPHWQPVRLEARRDLFGSEDPEELRREMTSTPFYTGLLLSSDAATAALLLEVAPGEASAARRHLDDAVRAAVQPLADAGFRVALAGAPVLIVALDDLSKREALQTFPISLAKVTFRAWKVFRYI